jgi:hypothetical protein
MAQNPPGDKPDKGVEFTQPLTEAKSGGGTQPAAAVAPAEPAPPAAGNVNVVYGGPSGKLVTPSGVELELGKVGEMLKEEAEKLVTWAEEFGHAVHIV